MTEKHKTCRHADKDKNKNSVLIAYVCTSCPNRMRVGGSLASSRILCRDCGYWEPREEAADGN